jgi:hypothetical protein
LALAVQSVLSSSSPTHIAVENKEASQPVVLTLSLDMYSIVLSLNIRKKFKVDSNHNTLPFNVIVSDPSQDQA